MKPKSSFYGFIPMYETVPKIFILVEIPNRLYKGNITPVYINGDRRQPENYRPVWLTDINKSPSGIRCPTTFKSTALFLMPYEQPT